MGRPFKIGLDYFPFDVDFFDKDEVQFVSSRFDEKGELIAVKLMCKIFRTTGYYIEWTDDTALLFSKGAGRNISHSLANDVVNELIRRGFFDRSLFERFSVLTSKNIQATYKKICTDAKRKEWKIRKSLALIELTPEEIELTHEESTQRKGKEIERKENESMGGAQAPPPKSFKKFSEEDFKDEIRTGNAELKLPDAILHQFFRYWSEKSALGLMKFQLEKTWDTKRRLETWRDNQAKFDRNGNKHSAANQNHVSTGRTVVRDQL